MKDKIEFRKFIITHEACGAKFTNGFIIPNLYDHSHETWLKIIAEARKDFDIIDSDLHCCTVVKSGWCKGCPILRFPLPIGSKAEGWTLSDRLGDVGWQ